MDEKPDLEETPKTVDQVRKFFIILLGIVLLLTFLRICEPFLVPVSWATVLVVSAWPLHIRLLSRMPKWPGVAASITSSLMLLTMLAIMLPVIRGLGPELKSAGIGLADYVTSHQTALVQWVGSLPLVGPSLAQSLSDLGRQTQSVVPLLEGYSDALFGTASTAAQGLLAFLFKVGVFCLAVFFLLFYGQEFSAQVRLALVKMDERSERLMLLTQNTVTGVLYGLVFTALAQGVLAGVGFAVAGVRAPILLGLVTAFLSLVPFGPQLIYVPASILLLVGGSPLAGVLLAAWGFLVVSSADNVLKPYFIARQIRFPLPLALLGAVGGVISFGLIGVFVGPVVVALVRNFWLDWISDAVEPELPVTPEAGPVAIPEAQKGPDLSPCEPGETDVAPSE